MIKVFNIGIKGVVVIENKVLLLKKQDPDGGFFWDIPGGRIDGDETILETLSRELKEELPTIPSFTVEKLLSAYRLEKNLKDGSGLMLLFYKVSSTPFEVILSDEHMAYQWFSHDDLVVLKHDEQTAISPGYLDVALSAVR